MQKPFCYPDNYIRFLGTAGARMTMIHQLRHTAGIWVNFAGMQFVIDPGPGCLSEIGGAFPELDATDISSIILTHRHIDHSTDINVMIEAMTIGGKEKRGNLIIPEDAIYSDDPVVLKYSANKVKNIFCPKDSKVIRLENGITVEPVLHIHHGVETYGYIFSKNGHKTWGLISDSKPLNEFMNRYKKCEFLIVNCTMQYSRPNVDHFSLPDVANLLEALHPKLVILNHLGRNILQHRPNLLAKKISTATTKVLPGRDGMIIDLDLLNIFVHPVRRVKHISYKSL